MTLMPLAAGTPHYGVVAGMLAFSFLVGTFGHIIKSRTVIITGLLLVAMTSFFFLFVIVKPFAP